MKWLGVVGTREVNDTIRRDIEQCVGQKITEGGGIVSGGATGADHEAARLAYEYGLEAARFRVFLPVELGLYCKALYDRAAAGKCRPDDVVATVALLQKIAKNRPGVIYDTTDFTEVNAESFHARNCQIVDLADELVAFRVNNSPGTTFTIDQAREKGIPIKVFDYTID
ncbi:hypothetical protein FBF26_02865 [Candidatus Saccharibacteria bacterium oral taxon 488]|nr:hypothetical protein FBF26_02865 [Candidatus Saccharibacteria bacterium oral taxon 488]